MPIDLPPPIIVLDRPAIVRPAAAAIVKPRGAIVPGLVPGVGLIASASPVVLTPASSDSGPSKNGSAHTFSSAALGADPGSGLVVVAVAGLSNMTNKITGCSVAGRNATELHSHAHADNTDVAVFVATGVTVSTGDIVITLAGSNSNWRPHYAAYRKSGGVNGVAHTRSPRIPDRIHR